MEILFVAATCFESQRLLKSIGGNNPQGDRGLFFGENKKHALLVTGIGMVNSARGLSLAIEHMRPKLIVNFGIAGAFFGGPEILEVVEVVEDCFPEMGAEDSTGFLDLEELGFVHFHAGGRPYFNRMQQIASSGLNIRKAKGITVNTVHGRQASIDEVVARWNPEVETMEGAAVFQCCIEAGVPFVCLRAISNKVEPRNRDNWKIKEAIEAVEEFVIRKYVEGRS